MHIRIYRAGRGRCSITVYVNAIIRPVALQDGLQLGSVPA
jgi:hypothetical protein